MYNVTGVDSFFMFCAHQLYITETFMYNECYTYYYAQTVRRT